MALVDRELAWVLHSPNFFSQEASSEAVSQSSPDHPAVLPGPLLSPQVFEYLTAKQSAALLSRPEDLNKCIAQLRVEIPQLATGRLGLKFEKYLHTVLLSSFGEENVLTRVAVRELRAGEPVKTWGEYDFLVCNNALGQLEHWESSVKFYLQVMDDTAWKWCWGPGLKDRLDLKGPKTYLQQLALSSTQIGQKFIPYEWQGMRLVKRNFAKGTIFYRWNPSTESIQERLTVCVHPKALSADHLKSWWIASDHFVHLRQHYPDTMVAVLPRKYWMTGFDTGNCEQNVFETWDEFHDRLADRLKAAAERNECLLAGIYSNGPEPHLITGGFIATRLFTDAAEWLICRNN